MDILKRIGWLLLDLLVYLAIFVVIVFLFNYLIDWLFPMDYDVLSEEDFLMNPKLLMIEYAPLLISSIVAMILTHFVIFKRPLSTLGIGGHRLLRGYSWGWVLGFILVFSGFLILRITGQLDILSYDLNYSVIIGFFFFFLIQSLFEELAFRSYLIPAIEKRFGIWSALIGSSILFALIHIANSNISLIGMLNIFSAGVLLGILFIKYGNVWVASGLHFSWNYIQSTILGFEVSGEKTFNMIDTQEVGPDLITGGAFGFEGSIIALTFLIGLIIYYMMNDEQLRHKLELVHKAEKFV